MCQLPYLIYLMKRISTLDKLLYLFVVQKSFIRILIINELMCECDRHHYKLFSCTKNTIINPKTDMYYRLQNLIPLKSPITNYNQRLISSAAKLLSASTFRFAVLFNVEMMIISNVKTYCGLSELFI